MALRFSDGVRAAVPVMVGYLPAGMTFGILAQGLPIHIADLIGFSGVVFAGASQYMAINLLKTGAAYLEIIVATFLLNFRHFLMSTSLSQRLGEPIGSQRDNRRGPRNRAWRAVIAYGITDETFSVASTETRKLTPKYIAGLGLFSWLSWNVGSLIGFLGGSYLPERLGSAMGVALYALFAALLLPQVKKKMVTAAFAGIAAVLHYLLNLLPILGKGWAFIISMVVAAAIGALVLMAIERKKEAL
jgi:4-azaleucine resistance transporter AzlC